MFPPSPELLTRLCWAASFPADQGGLLGWVLLDGESNDR